MRTFFQNGSVLIVSLLLLLVITIVGIAGVSNSLLGERVAGNQKQISEAFMKAESGLVATMKFFSTGTNIAKWPSSATTWDRTKVSIEGLKDTNTDLHWYIHSIAFTSSEATIISCGEHVANNVKRCIKSSIVRGFGNGNLAAMNIIGIIDEYGSHSNKNFEITGEKNSSGVLIGPAIATNSQANVNKILNSSSQGVRENSYIGGVQEVSFTGPFGTANQMKLFLDTIKNECKTEITCLYNDDVRVASGGYDFPDATPRVYFLTCKDASGNNTVCTFGGNKKGSGILVIDGNLQTNGNFGFDGLVIVTGNSVQFNGLGNSGIQGAIAVTHLVNQGDEWSFGDAVATVDLTLNGVGASSQITFNRTIVNTGRALLGTESKKLWKFTSSSSAGNNSSGSMRVSAWSEVYL